MLQRLDLPGKIHTQPGIDTLQRPGVSQGPYLAGRPYALHRLPSIDVFRAITMFLMIFVNDLEPIPGVPEWLKHVGEHTDGLGFADTIFPAFLFIMGLSIPFALKNRMIRGDSPLKIALHIASRGLALILMGFFQVNIENYNAGAWLPRCVWEIGITLSFFAIWLDYPKNIPRSLRLLLQGGGIALLTVMALLFNGGTATGPLGLDPGWWGILGLIGWSYLICAGIFLVSKGHAWIQVSAALFFLLFNIADRAHLLRPLSDIRDYMWIAGNGAMPALTMGGIVISLLYRHQREKSTLPGLLALLGAAMIGFGFLVRPLRGISKIHNTPAWVAICMGISILVFNILIFVVDKKRKQNWFQLIKPAGTSTLTAYLLPYFLYSLYELCHVRYPDFLNAGIGGLLRSLTVALSVVLITGWLEKKHVRLKI
jgi:heparan-alpha-glucosaminide N-acetyltransferase